MENASKALLIAAGIMIGLIVITMIAYAHGKISNYYESKELTLQSEQLADFNKQFLGYNRADVRGSDLLSLVNKIVDYNDRKADPKDIAHEPMCLTIQIENNSTTQKEVDLFCFELDDYNYNKSLNNIILKTYTNVKNGKYDSSIDKYDILSNATSQIKGYYNKITDNTIPILSQNIYSIFDVYNKKYDNNEKEVAKVKRDNVLKEMFGKDTYTDTKIKNIEKAAYEAYQITQFKRAHFKCIEKDTKYNPNTGRIVSLHFEFTGEFN